MKTALTIAGSDSSGGAGIQADLKTFMAHGVYGMSVITAVTAQNTIGVFGVSDISEEMVGKQLDAVFNDIYPHSVKIGMVSSSSIIGVIAEKLTKYCAVNIVLDPVMISTSGYTLVDNEAVDTLKNCLFPLADIVTPNIPEAELICGFNIKNRNDMEKAAALISERFSTCALVKGGHLDNCSDDVLCGCGEMIWYNRARINNPNNHGTGCTLSSAIASSLALGSTIRDAVLSAKEFVSSALLSGLDLGKGHGPLNHCVTLHSSF